MWTFTKDGFFSVVHDQYCEKDELTVRARYREDLTRLVNRLRNASITQDSTVAPDDILKINHADYLWRIKIKRVEWSLYMAYMAMDVDYPTVKDNICPDKTRVRTNAMYSVWRAMVEMQTAYRQIEGQ